MVIQTIGSRIGWKGLGLLLSIAISVVAIVALARALKGVDVDQVVAAIRQTGNGSIALAAVLIAVSYASLTIYDLLALRLIGRGDIPYRIAALASFTSYPIAHGVGVVLPVSSAIRYRIYAPHGIGVGDVARICFLTGLTFWLGNLSALGLSMLAAPDAIGLITHLPGIAVQGLAATVLAVIMAYVVLTWSGTRLLGVRRWSVALPTGRLVFAQIGLGIVDLGAAALAMYVLIPADMHVEVARVVVVFITATLLGFASHAPAGIGVFDATILMGLGHENKEQLLAALLLFRLFYHLTPFVLALALFGAVEGVRAMQDRNAR
jgi:glycosyltransferase 2 family protein